MDITQISSIAFIFITFVLLAVLVKQVLMLRVVVPTNMVHIVQKRKNSTPYGRNKLAGNTYYAWPSWIPFIGVSVTQFP